MMYVATLAVPEHRIFLSSLYRRKHIITSDVWVRNITVNTSNTYNILRIVYKEFLTLYLSTHKMAISIVRLIILFLLYYIRSRVQIFQPDIQKPRRMKML